MKAPARLSIDAAAGKLEVAVNDPGDARRGVAVIAHPHPLFGGTLDNKVAQTLARAFFELGCVALRPNFRGVGGSEGAHDEGRGETDDLVGVVAWAKREYGEIPLILAGFSFGGFVQTRVCARVACAKLVLVAPAVGRIEAGNFEPHPVPPGTLVIHGEFDETVPLAACLEWARPQELPVIVVPGADHFFHRKLHIIKRLVQDACSF